MIKHIQGEIFMNQIEAVIHLLVRFMLVALWVACIILLVKSEPIQTIVLHPLACAISSVLSAAYIYRKKKQCQKDDGSSSSLLVEHIKTVTTPLAPGIVFALLGVCGFKNTMFSLSWGTALISVLALLWIDPIYVRLLCPAEKITLENGLFAFVQAASALYIAFQVSMPMCLLFIVLSCFIVSKKNTSLFCAVMAGELFLYTLFYVNGISGSLLFGLAAALCLSGIVTGFAGTVIHLIWDRKADQKREEDQCIS